MSVDRYVIFVLLVIYEKLDWGVTLFRPFEFRTHLIYKLRLSNLREILFFIMNSNIMASVEGRPQPMRPDVVQKSLISGIFPAIRELCEFNSFVDIRLCILIQMSERMMI